MKVWIDQCTKKVFNIDITSQETMEEREGKYFKTRSEWRRWLQRNHDKRDEVLLIYYKKHTGKPSVTHAEAVEEALCFGWIDSRVNRLDDERYMQRYTPRNPKSVWSKINKDAAERMIKAGKMTPAGLEKINEAKKDGRWAKAYTSRKRMRMPRDMKAALMRNKKAWTNFNNFAKSYQNMYIGWVDSAKRYETRKKRIKEVVKRSALNKKSGIM
jgi:uncharacterized protein YdeI (YjbR/CyaY-like superfamily)